MKMHRYDSGKSEVKGEVMHGGIIYHENGVPESYRTYEKEVVETPYGALIPRYSQFGIRRKDEHSLRFYESGALRSIALEEQTAIETSVGVFPAEHLSFFPNGSVETLLPLNGRLSFSWSEEEEAALATPFEFNLPFGCFSAKVGALRFYPDGQLRTLVLWPGEIIIIKTPLDDMAVRIGFKLYENGCIESVEPAFPHPVMTPLGLMRAYDGDAVGVDADKNSLLFTREGVLRTLTTSCEVQVQDGATGEIKNVVGRMRPGLLDDDLYPTPLKFTFGEGIVSIENGEGEASWALDEYDFSITYTETLGQRTCFGDCSGCEGC